VPGHTHDGESTESKDESTESESVASSSTYKEHYGHKEHRHHHHESRTGYWQVPDTDLFLKISGMIEATAVYDVNGTQSVRDNNFLMANLIDVPTGKGTNIRVDGRETRFMVQSLMPVGEKDLHAYLETDFIGAGGNSIETNGYALRIRHAYFDYNGFMAGQYWSGFVDTSAFFESTTCGPVALPQMRQALFGYTHKFGSNCFLLCNVENAQSEAVIGGRMVPAAGSTEIDDEHPGVYTPYAATTQNGLPDFVLGIGAQDSNYKAYLRGMIGRNTVLCDGRNYSRVSYAVALSGFVKLWHDKLTYSIGCGEGSARHFHDFQGGQSTYFDGAKLHNNRIFAVSVAFQHTWEKKHNIRSSLAYCFGHITNAPAFLADERIAKSKSYSAAHVNVMCSPLEKVTLGLEYIYATRNLDNAPNAYGAKKGNLSRLMFMARYVF
jgi:hypothetical protein